VKASEGASNFSRTKSLKEQREYLPAFACREDLMRTIRENQGPYSSSFLRCSSC
jgi:pre-mRNA-splicing factor ATP-dependent RNA helicase DHX38/PRP16